MKTMFLPRHLLKVSAALAALTFTQCDKKGADTTSASAPTASASSGTPGSAGQKSPALVSDGLSPSFTAVASRLELGGRAFEYSEVGGVQVLAKLIDEIISALPERERRDIPPGFTLTKLLKVLGVDSVVATGASSRARVDGSFHTRGFAHTPQGRKGLLTLSGGPAAKLMLLGLAPKDTDFAVEFPLSLKDFTRDALPEILAMIPPRDRAEFEKEMSQPVPGLGLSGKQVLEKLDARVGIYLRLDPSQKFQPAPGAPQFPGADGVIVIERLGWLVEALKPQFMPKLSEPNAPVSVTDEGGVLTVRFKGPSGPPPMDFQPVLRFDPKADRILIASRPALFDSVSTGKESITQGADFTQAWRDLPNEGNACIYASPRLLQTLSGLIETAMLEGRRMSDADRAVAAKIFAWVKPLTSRGQALVLANQPDGILVSANTSLAAGASTMTAVSTVAVLSSLAVPAFTTARVQATASSDLNNVRQVVLAVKIHANENNGRYPAALAELAPQSKEIAGILEFTDRRTGQRIPWLYQNTLNDSANAGEVLVAAPVPGPDGKRAVGFNDGSVRLMPEAEFQALWSRK